MIDFNPADRLILVVDDSSRNLQLAIEILEDAGYSTTFATGGKQALERIGSAHPDLILLDLMMPEIGGLEVCEILRDDPDAKDIPVIFLTASDDKHNIIEAFRVGAVDYITKPFYGEELLARVKTHLELKKTRDELHKAYIQLQQLVMTDYLSGIANRRAIFAFGEKEFKRFRRYGQANQQNDRQFSLLMLDIDHFKSINDNFGHSAGDKAIVSTATTLKNCLRATDECGRFGGEEFLVILPETSREAAKNIAHRLHETLTSQSIVIDERKSIGITVSIGVSSADGGDDSLDDVIKKADRALYRAKELGRNRVVVDGWES